MSNISISNRLGVGVPKAKEQDTPSHKSYSASTQVLLDGIDFSAVRFSSARTWVARLLNNLGFGSLLILPVLVAVPYGTVEAWWIAAYECVVFVLAAFWIIEGWLTGTWKIKERKLILPLVALVVFALLQTATWGVTGSGRLGWKAISADPFETRVFAWKLLALIVSGVLLRHYTSTRRRLRALVYVVIGIAVASALFGIVRQTMQGTERGFFLPYLQYNSGFAQFINKNHFALLMEMALGLVCGLVAGGGVRRERLLFYGAAAFLMWVALVLTTSRGGIFSMVVQMLFLFTIFSFTRRLAPDSIAHSRNPESSFKRKLSSLTARVALMACLLVAVSMGIIWMGGDVLLTRLQSLPDEVNPTKVESHAGVSRSEVWRATLKLSAAHPVLGSGFGGYGVAITRYHAASGKWTPEAAHNDYLELLANGGLIAIALVIWFGIVFIKRARECLRSLDTFRRAACMGALIGLFGVAVHSFVDFGLHITANALIFTVLIVIATLRDGDLKQTADDWQGGARGVPN